MVSYMMPFGKKEPFSLNVFSRDFNICHNFKNSNIYFFIIYVITRGCYLGLGEGNFLSYL